MSNLALDYCKLSVLPLITIADYKYIHIKRKMRNVNKDLPSDSVLTRLQNPLYTLSRVKIYQEDWKFLTLPAKF